MVGAEAPNGGRMWDLEDGERDLQLLAHSGQGIEDLCALRGAEGVGELRGGRHVHP